MTDQISIFASGLDHPESVVVDANGAIYAGGEAGQIYAIAPDGSARVVAETGGFALGLTADGSGHLYVCDLGRASVLRVDPRSGSVDVYSSGTAEQPMRSPNYSAFDTDGNLYVTDSGEWGQTVGRIYRVAPGGATDVWTDAIRSFPNGCCLSADGAALLVVESYPHPGIASIPIQPDGSAGTPRRVLELPEEIVPDGIAATVDGGFLIACYRPDRIYRYSPTSGLDVLADDPHGVVLAAPTNIAFTGPRRDRILIASLGRWHIGSATAPVAGSPLNYPILDR